MELWRASKTYFFVRFRAMAEMTFVAIVCEGSGGAPRIIKRADDTLLAISHYNAISSACFVENMHFAV